MHDIERVLVPVDFSECSWAASKYAELLARRLGAEIHMLHVWRVPWYLDEHALTRAGRSETLSVLAHNRAQAEMERFNEIGARSTVTSGTPRNAILEIAELGNHDLIVMGTHGRTGLAHLFLGSTAEGVVRRAPCPVLTVRNNPQISVETEAREATGSDIRLKRILVPVDLCDCSAAALEYAVDFARAFNASIDVLHVVDLPHCGTPVMPIRIGEERMGLAEFAMKEAAPELEKMLRPLRERSTAIESRIVVGYPRDEIIGAIDGRYDMVIVGTHGRQGLSHFLLGSVAEKVVRRSPCPVLTIRSRPD